MDNSIWEKMHGGATHFPIALLAASLLFDVLACLLKSESHRRDLRAAAFYSLLVAALGAVGAVISGLILSNGVILGTDTVAKHHMFVWPAFALVIGLAVWRLLMQRSETLPHLKWYLVLAFLANALMSTAGYWGGEMLIGH